MRKLGDDHAEKIIKTVEVLSEIFDEVVVLWIIILLIKRKLRLDWKTI